MEKDINKLELINHNISITERQNIAISGVTKIDSFDNEEFLLETTAGPLGIKGSDLEIIKLDTYEGTIVIKGIIDAFSYLENLGSKKKTECLQGYLNNELRNTIQSNFLFIYIWNVLCFYIQSIKIG